MKIKLKKSFLKHIIRCISNKYSEVIYNLILLGKSTFFVIVLIFLDIFIHVVFSALASNSCCGVHRDTLFNFLMEIGTLTKLFPVIKSISISL